MGTNEEKEGGPPARAPPPPPPPPKVCMSATSVRPGHSSHPSLPVIWWRGGHLGRKCHGTSQRVSLYGRRLST